MSQYRITLPASRDLEQISSYFAVVNVKAGTKLLRKFNLPLNGHIIFYAVTNEEIDILRVVRGNRDLRNLFEIEEE